MKSVIFYSSYAQSSKSYFLESPLTIFKSKTELVSFLNVLSISSLKFLLDHQSQKIARISANIQIDNYQKNNPLKKEKKQNYKLSRWAQEVIKILKEHGEMKNVDILVELRNRGCETSANHINKFFKSKDGKRFYKENYLAIKVIEPKRESKKIKNCIYTDYDYTKNENRTWFIRLL